MTNIWLFLATVVAYASAVSLYWWIKEGGIYSFFEAFAETWSVKRFAILLLLCIPFNIYGNVFTVLGNAVSEKDMYSILSFYQKAGGDTASLLSLGGYQEGKDVNVLFGIPSYQKSTGTATLVFGASPYQKGNATVIGCGLAVCQTADKASLVLFGLSVYQKADINITLLGLSGYQKAVSGAFSQFALYQELEGGKNRSFGIWGFGESVFVKKPAEKSKTSSAKQ